MTHYIELFGLPGSGKTAILNYFTKEKGASKRNVTISHSPSLAAAHIRHLKSQVSMGKADLESRNWWLSMSALGWAESCQNRHHPIFFCVFRCLREIPETAVGRDKLLGYWKIRMSEYDRISATNRPTLVDEGVTQAAFSTLSRFAQGSTNRRVNLERLLAELPASRTVVLVKTPLKEATERSLRGKGGVNRMTSKAGEELVSEIWSGVRQSALKSFSVDGSLGPKELHAEISQKLNLRAEAEPKPLV